MLLSFGVIHSFKFDFNCIHFMQMMSTFLNSYKKNKKSPADGFSLKTTSNIEAKFYFSVSH